MNPTSETMDSLKDAKYMAKFLNLTGEFAYKTVLLMAKRKVIPCHRIGRMVRFDPKEVLRSTRS